MSDLWLGVISTNNRNYVKRYKQRINAFNMASNKMKGFVLTTRWEGIAPIFADEISIKLVENKIRWKLVKS